MRGHVKYRKTNDPALRAGPMALHPPRWRKSRLRGQSLRHAGWRVDQFQIDRRIPKMAMTTGSLASFITPSKCGVRATVPDEAAGRHPNAMIRVEILAAVHPPGARHHDTQTIRRVPVRAPT